MAKMLALLKKIFSLGQGNNGNMLEDYININKIKLDRCKIVYDFNGLIKDFKLFSWFFLP